MPPLQLLPHTGPVYEEQLRGDVILLPSADRERYRIQDRVSKNSSLTQW